ncbi:hypothetical protein KY347_03530 [Candidatus Woesearchaeota archaeon]|nr:hypothetical protein [Candidatus Woesearchaeota archaeon]
METGKSGGGKELTLSQATQYICQRIEDSELYLTFKPLEERTKGFNDLKNGVEVLISQMRSGLEEAVNEVVNIAYRGEMPPGFKTEGSLDYKKVYETMKAFAEGKIYETNADKPGTIMSAKRYTVLYESMQKIEFSLGDLKEKLHLI